MIAPPAWEPAPDNGVSQCIFTLCHHIFLLQMTPTSLSSKVTWSGRCTLQAGQVQVEAAVSFSVPRVISVPATTVSSGNLYPGLRKGFLILSTK